MKLNTGIGWVQMAVIVSLWMGISGCGIWPIMTEENGRRPKAMGKSDQVFYPWAPQPVHLSEEYGVSYRYALENQILNPQSVTSLKPVEGLDGRASQYGITRYQLMFENPPYSNTTLEVGGSKSGKSGGGK